MKDFHVVLETKEHKGLCMVLYGVMGTVGLVCACLFAYSIFSDDPSERILGLFLLPPAALFLMFGGSQLLQLAKKIHLVPQGIAVTLWGRTLVRYPIEEIGMFFAVEWWEKGWVRHLGISNQTPEQFTQIREKELQKGVFTRDELKFRKRVPDWQQIFRQEYLLKRAKMAWAIPWKWDILWLDLTPDTLATLRHFYPQVPREYLRRRDDWIADRYAWKDRDPVVFPRRRGSEPQSQQTTVLCFAIFMIPMLFAALFIDGLEMLSMLVIEFGLILGILLALSWGDSDMFHLSAAGIRIMRGKQEHAAMFAGEIRTILKCEGGGTVGEFGGLSMVVSTVTAEELIQRSLVSTRSICGELPGEIPGWEKLALIRLCTQLVTKAKSKNADCQVMSWNSQREQSLRELYPNAEWIDLTAEAIYL